MDLLIVFLFAKSIKRYDYNTYNLHVSTPFITEYFRFTKLNGLLCTDFSIIIKDLPLHKASGSKHEIWTKLSLKGRGNIT